MVHRKSTWIHTRDGNGALFTISPQWIPLIPSLYSIDAYLISSPSRYSSSIDMMYIYCCVLIYDPCLTVCWVDYFGKILMWYTVEVHRGRGNHEDKFTAWWSWRKYSPVVVDGGSDGEILSPWGRWRECDPDGEASCFIYLKISPNIIAHSIRILKISGGIDPLLQTPQKNYFL